jgi:exodeoxyribonuclease-3
MKLLSWNVNGIRAVARKEALSPYFNMGGDVLCFQETKATVEQVKEVLSAFEGYEVYANEAEKKGYSGTAVATRVSPLSVSYGIGAPEHDKEGRVITLEFNDYFLITVYTPNSSSGLKRLPYRQEWDKAFYDFMKDLEKKKPVVVCGDLNVANTEIDLANPKSNYNKNPGFMQEEIDGIERYLQNGFIDTYRQLNPEKVKYSWWSLRAGARSRNVGWRIDYFLISESLKPSVANAEIHNQVEGSDHCPVELELK